MSLTILPDIVQGTDEWHDVRRGMVTASSVGKLVTPKTLKPAANPESRELTALLAAERITGYTEPTYQSDDMLRGQLDEPLARETYARHYGVRVDTAGFMVRTFDDDRFGIGYSPDGLVEDDGLIEVKSRRAKKHVQTVVSKAVPLENMAQIMCGLLVSGRAWCDYVSYCGGEPMWTRRVWPDDRWFEAIVTAVRVHEAAVERIVATYLEETAGFPATERIDHYAEIRI